MIATLIRNITHRKAKPLAIEEDKAGTGELGQVKIALITDTMSTLSFAQECRIKQLSPYNYKEILQNWRPHFVFIESAFHGMQDTWLYRIAKQPKYIQQLKPHALEDVITFAKDLHIPTLFWNKDDIPYFDAFLHVAQHVDYVFTADSNFIPRYQAAVPDASKVHLLAMAYQPAFHNFTGFHFKKLAPCFLGSYYVRMLKERQRFFEYIFQACSQTDSTLHVYNRHKNHLFHATHFRFPEHANITLHEPVPYEQTQEIYKYYSISLNINSVTNSDTMLSRRFLEILACGGILLSNPSPVVQKNFSSYCHCVHSQEQATELLARWKFGPSQEDKEKAEAGAQYVLQNHTWRCRLEQIATLLNI